MDSTKDSGYKLPKFLSNKRSYIDQLGLEDVVLDLVQKGKSYIEISNELTKWLKVNDKDYGGYKFSKTAVYNYCRKHGWDKKDNRAREYNIDLYKEYQKQLGVLNKQIKTLEIYLNEYDSKIDNEEQLNQRVQSICQLNTAIDKLIARKNQLMAGLTVIQEKIFGFRKIYGLISFIMNEIKEKDPEIYEKVIKKIEKDEYLLQMMNGIN